MGTGGASKLQNLDFSSTTSNLLGFENSIKSTSWSTDNNGIPWIFFLSNIHQNNETTTNSRYVEANSLRRWNVCLGRVVETFQEVEGGATDGSHSEQATDVVEDAIGARWIWKTHKFSTKASSTNGVISTCEFDK